MAAQGLKIAAFFYGTLLHPKVLKRVIGNDGTHLRICPAILPVRNSLNFSTNLRANAASRNTLDIISRCWSGVAIDKWESDQQSTSDSIAIIRELFPTRSPGNSLVAI